MNRTPALVSTAIAVAVLLTVARADFAYMQATGQKQGGIKGSVTQKGREGQIRVYQVSHEIVSPRDPASGLPTGRRQHKPFQVFVELDRATPLFFNALVTNENLTEVILHFWKPSQVGAEVNHFNVKLTNASVASIRTFHPDPATTPTFPDGVALEFTYQKIEWTYTDGGVTASDDWQANQ